MGETIGEEIFHTCLLLLLLFHLLFHLLPHLLLLLLLLRGTDCCFLCSSFSPLQRMLMFHLEVFSVMPLAHSNHFPSLICIPLMSSLCECLRAACLRAACLRAALCVLRACVLRAAYLNFKRKVANSLTCPHEFFISSIKLQNMYGYF